MKLGLSPLSSLSLPLLVGLAGLVGCGGGTRAAEAPTGGVSRATAYGSAAGYPSTPMAAPSPGVASESAAADAPMAPAPPPPPPPVAAIARPRSGPQSGLLTAGVWDDAKNFDFFLGYSRRSSELGRDFQIFSEKELANARQQTILGSGPKRALDVAIVFDTTGSMGDELRYLQTEMVSIASTLRAKLPEVEPRFSLVVYRDKGDAYVTQTTAFTTDVASFRRALATQSADGGGDYPEAVIAGLKATSALDWRADASVAKVAFWIADAPTHEGEASAYGRVVRNLRDRGVHLYPIAASGADELTEYEMRSAALMTGGRYMFLTDDSGVGNAHAEPKIPCYAVTRLDRAIVRMLEIEVTGRHVAAVDSEIVRKVGAPQGDGTCKLANGELVAAY